MIKHLYQKILNQKIMGQKILDPIFLRYICVGLISTLSHYLTFVTAHKGFDLSVTISTVLGFIVSLCVSYALNYHFTFESQTPHRRAIWRFISVTLIGLGLNVAIMNGLINGLNIHYNIAFLIMSVAVMLNNFILSRKFVF